MKEAMGNLDRRKMALQKLEDRTKEFQTQNLTTSATITKIE
jgi:hypothetical protein